MAAQSGGGNGAGPNGPARSAQANPRTHSRQRGRRDRRRLRPYVGGQMSTHEAGEDAEAVVRTVPAETDSAQSAPEQSEEAQIVAKVGNSRTDGTGQWPTWTTSVSDIPERWTGTGGRRAPGRRRLAPGGRQPRVGARACRRRVGRLVEGVRAVRDQAVEILARLGFPGTTRSVCPSTRRCMRWWPPSRTALTSSREPSYRSCVQGTAKARINSVPPL